GSGLVEMVDGSQLRVGYAGQNGHIYTPIGRILINDYGIPKEEMSMQRIRRWLEENPGEADALMNQNRSYVFFEAKEQGGAIGAAGLPLMPRRSLAVDRTLWSYGAPVWLSAPHPVVNQPRLERLMIAEDTGGAIRGPVRGDFFWGHGMEAEQNAGLMKSYGQMWVLLPR
ncbi:MAG: MltA domain-containing protein, partial [Pseudomonadota bacterium]